MCNSIGGNSRCTKTQTRRGCNGLLTINEGMYCMYKYRLTEWGNIDQAFLRYSTMYIYIRMFLHRDAPKKVQVHTLYMLVLVHMAICIQAIGRSAGSKAN